MSAKTHGERRPPTHRYMAWYAMLQRCNNPRHRYWKDYGGRGIKVCKRWHKFENFRDDVGVHPGKGWTLDRPKNDENYGPDNWRWATRAMQSRNRRSNKISSLTAAEIRSRYVPRTNQYERGLGGYELAKIYGVNNTTIYKILNKQAWT